ncbi:MAG: hypothetical protein AAGD05_01665 [Bacteroidota bacterium]
MKKFLYLLLFPCLLMNCGQEQVSLLDMPYQVQFTIPAGLSAFENWCFLIENIPNNKNTLFAGAGLEDAEITEIRGKTARLSTIFTDEEYDFIYDISVRIYKDDPDDYRELFYRAEVPLNASNQLDLIGGDNDVQQYLQEPTFNILVRITPRETLLETFDNRLDFEMFVR